jgi:(1->4)-alpha-D-glucan 1-alpha-D-glucosylmutase
VPDRNEEYLFYQTLIGAWPLEEDAWRDFLPRLQEYFIKASREANVRTRWVAPNQAHESALRDFVAGVVDRERNREFCDDFEQVHRSVALYGMLNGLGQTLLKAAAPGVPDCYQGSELWDLRLVDPDNRGLIDYDTRRAALEGLRAVRASAPELDVEALLASWRDGRVKMHVLATALNVRQANPALFSDGSYIPLAAEGEHAQRVVAFARTDAGDWAVSVFPRCVASVEAPVMRRDCRQKFWQATQLALPDNAPKRWTNVLAGNQVPSIGVSSKGTLPLADAFERFPLALLLPSPR